MKLLRGYQTRKRDRRLDGELARRSGISWSRLPPCSAPLYDAGAAQIGDQLYVFGGYHSLDDVSDKVRILDLKTGRWLAEREAVANLAQSHCAITTDGERFIYIASGQLGNQCHPAIPDVWSYDTIDDEWAKLPPLPAARYAGTMQLWRSKLHFVGGAMHDRWTPAADHWNLLVSKGQTIDETWRKQRSIPVGGMHRGSAIIEDQLFVFGGQQGDFIAIPDDPDCKCDGLTQETYLADSFRLDEPEGEWNRISNMPIPASHTDFSTVEIDGRVLIIGGQIYKDPTSFYLRLTSAIQEYDPKSDRWSIVGHLPFPLKIPVVGSLDRTIVIVGGQRNQPNTDLPGAISAETWKGELPEDSSEKYGASFKRSFFEGRSFLLISHELTLTGAPLLLMETAAMLMDAGATVRLASLGDDSAGWSIASELGIPVVPIETAAIHAEAADFVVANTATSLVMNWTKEWTALDAQRTKKLVCWIHEINADQYLPATDHVKDAGLVIFDSHACQKIWSDQIGDLKRSAVVHPAVNAKLVKHLNDERQLFPIHPGVVNSDVELLTTAEVRARLGIKTDDFFVLCVGSIEARKGQKLLLATMASRATAANLPLKLGLVGFKNWRRRLKFLWKMTPQERRVLSSPRCYVQQKNLAAFYKAADAFVMNSQGLQDTHGENFGRVTVEAMAAGAAVLGTNAGGTPEIIENGKSGLLFPVGASGQSVLGDQIEELCRARELTIMLQKNGEERALNVFSEARFFSEFENAFRREFGNSSTTLA